MARPEKIRLGDLLVQQKLITQEQLIFVLGEQKRSGKKLGKVMIDNAYVTEDQISEALAKQLNIPFINLKFYNSNPEIIKKLSETHARRFRALALEERNGSLLIGMADPTDLFAFDELSRIVGRSIELAVVTEGQLLEMVDRVYSRTEELSGLARELSEDLGDTAIDFGALGSSLGIEDAPVVKLLQSMFDEAIKVRASDIHIEPQERRLQIRFRIDGSLHLQTEADSKIAPALVLRLKLMSGLDISEKRLPQDGRFSVRVNEQRVDLRIASCPTQYGESVVMRLLRQDGGMIGLDKLGMPPEMLKRFREIIRRSSGMVLVTGPTGSGKTTTLYSALSEINTMDQKIITVEDPVEYRLPGINQVQVNEKIDLSFSRVLRSVLRLDPDIILVGEIRDHPTAEMAFRAAMTGHQVFSTLHTNSAIGAIPRLQDIGILPDIMAGNIIGIIAQRLVRVLCPHCKLAYHPEHNEQKLLGLHPGETPVVYRATGCDLCRHQGYSGRLAIMELLKMDADFDDLVAHRASNRELKQTALDKGFRPLAADGIRRILEGVTSLAEVTRVVDLTDRMV